MRHLTENALIGPKHRVQTLKHLSSPFSFLSCFFCHSRNILCFYYPSCQPTELSYFEKAPHYCFLFLSFFNIFLLTLKLPKVTESLGHYAQRTLGLILMSELPIPSNCDREVSKRMYNKTRDTNSLFHN